MARFGSGLGAFRLLPRGPAPSRAAREALAPHVPRGATLAVMSANHPGRYVFLIVGRDGRPYAVGKVAADARGHEALQREARALTTFGARLPSPLSAPALVAHDKGVLLLEAVRWTPRLRPWNLPPDVARALGELFRTTAREDGSAGTAHGDCAPWNLLHSDDRWVLVDWEASREDAPPFFDVFHYIVQSHVLLRHRSPEPLLKDLATGRGRGAAAL
jgi:hypothetical protein